MISHLQMITVFVSDIDRALAFYTEKLDFVKLFDFKDDDNLIVWILPREAKDSPHATWIGLSLTTPDDPRIGTTTGGMVFTTKDVPQTYRDLKAKGVHFTLDLIHHPYNDHEARFIDPDGNEFLLHS